MSGYSDRYSVRVDYAYLETPEFLGKSAVSGVEAHHRSGVRKPEQAPRRTSQQLNSLWNHLSERDQQLLITLGRLRLATTDQLQRQLFFDHLSIDSATRITRRCVNRLVKHCFVRPLGRRIGGIKSGSTGMVWTLTPHGHRLLGNPKRQRLNEPSITHIRHVLAIAELATELTVHAREQKLELDIQTEPDCWRPTPDTQPPLKPDLYVEIANRDTELFWFIEIDRGTESGNVIAKKLKGYDTYWRTGIEQTSNGVFPKVAWITPDHDRAAFISRHAHHRNINTELFTAIAGTDAIANLTDFIVPPGSKAVS